MKRFNFIKKILFLIISLTPLFNFSQSIKGKIFDEHKNPISNVLILNKNNAKHTHSNSLGNFEIDGFSKDSISFSTPNYENLTLKISTTSLEIILHKKVINLKEVVITKNLKNLNTIAKIDLELQPVKTSQELLRKVPGLFIGQHAGGGKAEQIFLRGFDIDHGTDVAISVDGMPVNMVSHAHGQGYADLHFLIPETVNKIDFDKGTYFADKGDFTTAGYVSFTTKDFLENNFISQEIGQFNYLRTIAGFNILDKENQSAYITNEYILTDNYFDSSQNFNRINLFGKYTAKLNNNDKLSISLSHFTSKWDASGQIPERAVNEGSISHFGAIDNTEGGNTSRSNFNIQYRKQIDENTVLKNSVYLNKYDFELFSNFTFFLNDHINGDQIKQKENRTIIGFQSEYNQEINSNWSYKFAIGLRNDSNKNVELSHTINRQTVLNYLSLGDVNQSNLFSYAGTNFSSGKWLINLGLRADYFKFNYVDKLASSYKTQSESKAILLPKINFLYAKNKNLSFFLKLGRGFHSNDTRVVVAQQGKEILPAAYSSDLGFTYKPFSKFLFNASIWYLYLEQEFVYVGDEAVVEPSGKTNRKGIDLGFRYQLNKWLFWNSDFTYTHARTTQNKFIPLAPVTTFVNGFSVKNLDHFSGSLQTRFLGNRPANEDNSVVAEGYIVTDLSLNYKLNKVTLGINIENFFNIKWKETQFLTESRLFLETNSVEEIHYTAGTPINVSFKIKYIF